MTITRRLFGSKEQKKISAQVKPSFKIKVFYTTYQYTPQGESIVKYGNQPRELVFEISKKKLQQEFLRLVPELLSIDLVIPAVKRQIKGALWFEITNWNDIKDQVSKL